jgi:hypothetical protein
MLSLCRTTYRAHLWSARLFSAPWTSLNSMARMTVCAHELRKSSEEEKFGSDTLYERGQSQLIGPTASGLDSQ